MPATHYFKITYYLFINTSLEALYKKYGLYSLQTCGEGHGK
jgi:hypothetical protein